MVQERSESNPDSSTTPDTSAPESAMPGTGASDSGTRKPTTASTGRKPATGPAERPVDTSPPGPGAVEDGLAIARSAARLSLKNRMLMDILAQGHEFVRTRYMHAAMQILTELADEGEAEVAYLEQAMKKARGLGFRSTGMHDYRRGDVANLKKRRKNAQDVAGELRRLAHNEQVLSDLIDDAQQAAWREVARNIEFNLDSEFAPVPVPDDAEARKERDRRLHEVVKQDLPRLEREHRRAERRARAATMEAERQAGSRSGGPVAKLRQALGRVFRR